MMGIMRRALAMMISGIISMPLVLLVIYSANYVGAAIVNYQLDFHTLRILILTFHVVPRLHNRSVVF